MTIDQITELLGEDSPLLEYEATGVSRDRLHLPGVDFVERVMVQTDRSTRVLTSLRRLWSHGRLANTGYVSILSLIHI